MLSIYLIICGTGDWIQGLYTTHSYLLSPLYFFLRDSLGKVPRLDSNFWYRVSASQILRLKVCSPNRGFFAFLSLSVLLLHLSLCSPIYDFPSSLRGLGLFANAGREQATHAFSHWSPAWATSSSSSPCVRLQVDDTFSHSVNIVKHFPPGFICPLILYNNFMYILFNYYHF